MTKGTRTTLGFPGPQDGAANFALTPEGSLVYITDRAVTTSLTLDSLDTLGNRDALIAEPRDYGLVRLSPDGARLALDIRDEENDIWIWSLADKSLTRLTFDPTPDFFPVWAADSRSIFFSSRREGHAQIFSKPANGAGRAERVSSGSDDLWATTASPDGNFLVVHSVRPETGQDLLIQELDGRAAPEELIATRFNEAFATISPVGDWMAYRSDESGRNEIYVTPFPDVRAGRWQISRTEAPCRDGAETAARFISRRQLGT